MSSQASSQDFDHLPMRPSHHSSGSRLKSLDGLRGVAAAVVLVHHALLTIPALAAPYYGEEVGDGVVTRALVFTPLHLTWAGTEAVYVFFVLSGLVLALPVLNAAALRWRVYYPQRLIRLYLPVGFAVAFGTALTQLIRRDDAAGLGAWLGHRSAGEGLRGLLLDLTLVMGPSGLITPLWSLQWEVLFSLALPLYLLVVLAARRHHLVTMAVTLAAIATGAAVGNDVLTYMPIFAIGVLLAAHLDELRAAAERLPPRAWWALLLVLVLLLSSRWIAAGLGASDIARAWTTPLAVVGAAGAVLTAVFWPVAAAFLQMRGTRWLGTISFSLYLVHEPIVIAAALLLGPGRGWLVLPVAAPIALLAAVVFFRVVEAPSHHLARRVGATFARAQT